MSGKWMAVLLGLVVGCHARADDLSSIAHEALAKNARYRAAEAQYNSVREHVPQSLASLLPSLAVTANTFWNDETINTLGRLQYNSNGWTVTLTQPVWRPQSLIALDEARAEVVRAGAQLNVAREDLLVHAAQAYFDVLYAEDVLSSFKEERAADLQQLQQAKRSFEVGSAPITDVRDAEARYALVVARELSASDEVESKRQVLRQIIDRDPGPLAGLRPGAVLTGPVPDSLHPWEAAAQTDNAAVLAAQAALDAAHLEARKARAGRLPTVDLVATHGFSRSPLNIEVGQTTHADSVGIQVSMPIYAGGGPSAKIREDLDLIEKAHADLDDARQSSVLDAHQAYLGASSGLALVRALRNAVTAGQTAVESNQRGIQVGARMRVDVLNAQKDLAETRRDLAKARYGTIMWLLKLKAAAGALSGTDINEVNALLVAPPKDAESK